MHIRISNYEIVSFLYLKDEDVSREPLSSGLRLVSNPKSTLSFGGILNAIKYYCVLNLAEIDFNMQSRFIQYQFTNENDLPILLSTPRMAEVPIRQGVVVMTRRI